MADPDFWVVVGYAGQMQEMPVLVYRTLDEARDAFRAVGHDPLGPEVWPRDGDPFETNEALRELVFGPDAEYYNGCGALYGLWVQPGYFGQPIIHGFDLD